LDKRIKLFAVLTIALILLATPASAYTVTRIGRSNDIQVKYQWYEAPILASGGAYAAAQQVMNLAKQQHMVVNRNTLSIASEISLHALFYIAGSHVESANPADIFVNEGNWDYLR
jgi:hypothetical protein